MGEVTIADLEELATRSPVRLFHFKNLLWEKSQPEYAEWIDLLGNALEYCSELLSEAKERFQGVPTSEILDALCSTLAQLGFNAQPHHGDSVLVKLRGYSWIGSCVSDKDRSIHDSFRGLISNLHGRANSRHGGLLFFCFNSDAQSALKNWQSTLERTSGITVTATQNPLTVISSCSSPTSGLTLFVTHISIPMKCAVCIDGTQEKTNKHVVVLVHGIRTHAGWAELVRAQLTAAGIDEVVPIRYGYFDVFRFLLPGPTRRGPIADILRELRDIRRNHLTDEISVIAHSFGTYAISKVLEEHEIFFNRVIFCGSIVSADFRRLAYQAQLGPDPIVNDCGSNDIWPVLANALTWGYGPTGTFGFGSSGIRDRYHPFKHASYFDRDFVDSYWAPFLVSGKIVTREWEETRPSPPWHLSVLSSSLFRYVWIALAAVAIGTLFYL